MADIADRSITIVGGDQNQHRSASRPIAFEHDFIDLPALELARAAHDGALDVVGRHADGLRRGDRGAKARVHIGIAAAAGSDRNLFDHAGKHFPALGIEGGFLMLDGRPF